MHREALVELAQEEDSVSRATAWQSQTHDPSPMTTHCRPSLKWQERKLAARSTVQSGPVSQFSGRKW